MELNVAKFERRVRPHKTLVVGTGGETLHEFLSVPADYGFDAA